MKDQLFRIYFESERKEQSNLLKLKKTHVKTCRERSYCKNMTIYFKCFHPYAVGSKYYKLLYIKLRFVPAYMSTSYITFIWKRPYI